MNVLFFGTPEFSVPTLETLLTMDGIRVGAVVTQPDKASGRGGQIHPTPVKRVATSHGIPIFQPTSLRREFGLMRDNLAALGPFDIGVVIAFGQILPQEVLSFPKHGCINIHASLLPRWRGAAPIQRAIEAGDAATGACLMQMDVGLDTGAVFSSSTISISPSDTSSTLHDQLSHAGAALLQRDLSAILSGKIPAISQLSEGVTYAAKVTAKDCEIDWKRPASQLSRQIRAFSPHPGTHTTWQGRRVKILAGHEIHSPVGAQGTPASVISSPAGHLVIACGERSALEIDEIQVEGKKRMSSADFLRGTTIPTGAIFGR